MTMSSGIVLHGYWRSSASYRVRIGLNLKGLDYEYRAVNLVAAGGAQYAPGYRELNPESRVPTLQAGSLVLTQSLAILEWLDEQYPRPPMLPQDAAGRARVRALAQLLATDVQPLQNTSVTRYLGDTLQVGPDGVQTWLRHWISRGMAAFESHLAAGMATGDFCHGDSPTLADACLVPQCYAARRFGVPVEQYPLIARIESRCLALSAFASAAPERQPDATG